MLNYELQNFTFTKGKIYPNDWLQTKPYNVADEVDRYYVGLANRVAETIKASCMADSFDDRNDLLLASVWLTGWFEDICSETGVWRVVNEECLKRYGQQLPFYDMTGYAPGEVNVQDIRLLVWDIVQSFHRDEGMMVNPENPGIEQLAKELYELFDGEYETAPMNERMYDFIHSDEVPGNFWESRGLLSWFHFRCYICHRSPMELADMFLRTESKDIPSGKRMYMLATDQTFKFRGNILSLTAAQWLARIRRDEDTVRVFENISMKTARPYLYLGSADTGIKVRDLVDEIEIVLDYESFNPNEFKETKYTAGKTLFLCEVLEFDGKHYMCGLMTITEMSSKLRNSLDEMCAEKRMMESQGLIHKDFLKATGGKDFMVARDTQEMLDFINGKMGFSTREGLEMPDEMKGRKDILMYADPKLGLQTIPGMAACLKMKGNKSYDKEYARKNALNFFCNDEAVSYRLACLVQDSGLLPDVFINSIRGEEYGRYFLQKNRVFITDYYLSGNREYDFDPYYGKHDIAN